MHTRQNNYSFNSHQGYSFWLLLTVISALLLMAVGMRVEAGTVYFVDQHSTGGNGLSWNSAFVDLQDALQVAGVGDEVWVAKGVYYPDQVSGTDTDDKTATFLLKNGVKLYGGFSGDGNETALSQRNVMMHATILSGDILQNNPNADGNHIAESYTGNGSDGSDHVVSVHGGQGVVLDGFVITAGDATSSSDPLRRQGAGMNVFNGAEVAVVDCRFSGNEAREGAGLLVNGATVSLDGCEFSGGNAWNHGGAIRLHFGGILRGKRCVFRGNRAWKGAGIMAFGSSMVELFHSEFDGNTATAFGGAAASNGADVKLVNSIVWGNTAAQHGGGFFCENSGKVSLLNCTVVANSAGQNGGGLFNNGATGAVVENSVFWGNVASGQTSTVSASQWVTGAATEFEDSLLENIVLSGDAGLNGVNGNSNPLFVDLNSRNIQLQSGSPLIDVADSFSRPVDSLDVDEDGDVVEFVAVDYYGRSRVAGRNLDIGAVEYAYHSNGAGSADEESQWSYPLGPIGGRFYMQTGKNLIRVSEITSGAPGAMAGLRAGDFIYGAYDEDFTPSTAYTWEFDGVVKELGAAVERAERGDGLLPLKVIRSGEGAIVINVQLAANGGLGPAFPLGSSVYAAEYEDACARLHQIVMDSASHQNETLRGNLGYNTGFAGLVMLAHPNWGDTSGAKPYRQSLNVLRDHAAYWINEAQYAPVEKILYDGSANVKYRDRGGRSLENWKTTTCLMFLAAYSERTGEVNYLNNGFANDLQRFTEIVANRVQWWLQPNDFFFPGGGGAHGGVDNDYGGGGFNVMAGHLMSAVAMAKNAKNSSGQPLVDMSVRPRDGRHFGYPDEQSKPEAAKVAYDDQNNPISILPEGWDPNLNPTLDDKIQFVWGQMKRMHPEDFGGLYYGKAPLQGYDTGGRTAGAVFGFSQSIEGDTTGLNAEDAAHLQLMKDYVVGHNSYYLHAHAHTASALYFSALTMPYLKSKERRYFLDSWKFYYSLSRDHEGKATYFPGRNQTDARGKGEMDFIGQALLYAVASGNVPLIPGIGGERMILDVKSLSHKWDEFDYREIKLNQPGFVADFAVVDSNSFTEQSNDYSVAWSVVRGDASNVSISSVSDLNAGIQFLKDGSYDLKLVITSISDSSNKVVEKFRFHVNTAASVAGIKQGEVSYEIFTGIFGETIGDLTSHGSFQSNTPRDRSVLHSLEKVERWDRFGARITGFITPKETGVYRFYVAGDDAAQLSIDTGGGLGVICSTSSETGQYEWDKDASQESVVINLTAGESYAFELLQKVKENSEGHVMAGWTTPSNSTIQVIGSGVLSRSVAEESSEVAILTQPIDVQGSLGDNVSLSVEVSGPSPRLFQWRRNGVLFGDPTGNPVLVLDNVGGGAEASYDCVYTAGGKTLISEAATLSLVDTGAITSGGMWVETYTGLVDGTFEDLIHNSNYPYYSTSSHVTASFESAPSIGGAGVKMGRRSSGWIVPTESGNYRFWFKASRYGELYLSPDEFRSHKRLIASDEVDAGTANHGKWISGDGSNPKDSGVSEYFFMEAGKRYYIEVLISQTLGDDYFGVNWQREGGAIPANGTFLPSSVLQYRAGGYYDDPAGTPAYVDPAPAIVLHPSNQTVTVGGSVNFSIGTVGPEGGSYQWRRNGINIGAASDRPLLALTNITDGYDAADYDCVYRVGDQELISNSATLTVTGGGELVNNKLLVDVYADLAIGTLDDLKSNGRFPNLPTENYLLEGSDFHEPLAGGPTVSHHFGQRASGWLIPAESGRYRLWFRAAEYGELYLSPDEYRAHRKLMVYDDLDGNLGNDYNAPIEFPFADASEYVTLEVGKRYYIEALQSEAHEESHFKIAWQKEGEAEILDIPASHFQYRVGGYYDDPINLPPFLGEDVLKVRVGQTLTVDLLANDSDFSGISLVGVSESQNGHLKVHADGRSITYSTTAAVGSTEMLQYTIVNGLGVEASGQILIEVVEGGSVDGLVAHWKMDEIINGQILDISGNGHHATVVNTLSIVNDAEFGDVLHFVDDTEGYLDVPLAVLSNIDDAMSISLWAYGEQATSTAMFFQAVDGNSKNSHKLGFYLHHHDGNILRFNAGHVNNRQGDKPDKVELPMTPVDWNGAWQHWVISKDKNAGVMSVYRDGELFAILQNATEDFIGAFTDFVIGTSTNGVSDWHGRMSDFRIYDRTLTAAQIQTLASGPVLAPFDLWKRTYFDEDQLADLSVSGLLADANGDGVVNLLDYAVHNDPFKPNRLRYVKGDMDASGQVIFRYTRLRGGTAVGPHHYRKGDLNYHLEFSSTLDAGTWQSASHLVEEVGAAVAGGNETEEVVVKPIGAGNQRFMRVRVEQE